MNPQRHGERITRKSEHGSNRPNDEAGVVTIAATSATSTLLKQHSIPTRNTQRLRLQPGRPVMLDHYIFTGEGGWKAAESMRHPTHQLTTDESEYAHINTHRPIIAATNVTVVTDTGVQSCLWGRADFHRCGFKQIDLLPVKRFLLTANKEEIKIDGAIFVRISGSDKNSKTHTAPIMAYVSPDTERFYLFREASIQLNVIPKNFLEVGAAQEISTMEHKISPCDCSTRTLPPERAKKLPFV